MKTMTCRQLGGACDEEFHADTWDEMAQLSKTHGMQMAAQKDEAHLNAMDDMREKMADSDAMNRWMHERMQEFEHLPEDK